MQNKIYIIWIWGIWISAIARYFLHKWYRVFWSDKINSNLIEELIREWCDIKIWERADFISNDIEKIVYSEAIPEDNSELQKAKELGLKTISYPQTLWEITDTKKLISIAGTHGKSTTTALTSLVLKGSEVWVNTIVGTLLTEFGWKNTHFSKSEYFVIEACEYKRSLLNYKPSVAVITNIELDHLDYYKDLEDYLNAFEEYINNIRSWWFVILNGDDKNCKKLMWKRQDVNYIPVYEDYFAFGTEKIEFPKIEMQIPGKHILFDAHVAYIIWHMVWVPDINILYALENYSWAWRRMEIIWTSENGNTLISDYWHHPTEIKFTLEALREKYPSKKIFTIFQPHQYSRTLELLEEFKNCFWSTDTLIIPDIYESRDSEDDKKKINSEKLIELINHPNKQDWKWLKNTLKLIQEYDKQNPKSSVILLLWAGDVDNLRFKIKTV